MLDKIIEISKETGSMIKEDFGTNFSIEFKTNASNIVTEVDKKAEKKIMDFIRKNYPGHSIIAEESGEHKSDSDYQWVVDPIDGTTNFAHGLPIFSVSIGVRKNEEIIYGVVYDIMRDVVYSAEKGSGAFYNGKKLKASPESNLAESLLVTGFPYDIKTNPHKSIEKFNAFLLNSRAVRRLGSAAIDLCYVAQGIFEGFWEVHLQPWDMCAGILLVEEAGGKVTNFNDEPINIFSKQILATNGKVHNDMLDILNMNS